MYIFFITPFNDEIGRYGEVKGLTNSLCSGECPLKSESLPASTSIMNCYCPIGYTPIIPTNDNGTECEACQYGWYKNVIGPASCLQCPPGYSVCSN
jgi:hypothetical protein